MKQKVGPAAIVIGVIVLILVMFGMYKVAFAPQSPEPNAANAPAYAKQRGVTPNGAGPPDYANTYKEGGQHSGAPGGMGAAPGAPPSSAGGSGGGGQ